MSAAWIIYFAGVSGGLNCVFSILGWLSVAAIGVIGFIAMLFTLNSPDKKEMEILKRALKIAVISLLGFGTLSAVVPSKDTVYLIASAKVTEDIVKSSEAKVIGDKILKVINTKLDEQIEEKRK